MPIIWTRLEGARNGKHTRKGYGTITQHRNGTFEIIFPEWNYHSNSWDKRMVVVKPTTQEECNAISVVGATAAGELHKVKFTAEELRLIEEHRADVAARAADAAETAEYHAMIKARQKMFNKMDVEAALDWFLGVERRTKGSTNYEEQEELWDAFENIGDRMTDLIKSGQQLDRVLLGRVRAVRCEDRHGCECRIDTVYGGYEDVPA